VAYIYENSNLTPCREAIGLVSMKMLSRISATVLNTNEGKATSQPQAYLEYILPNVYSHLNL
jgi:hypothetical protein